MRKVAWPTRTRLLLHVHTLHQGQDPKLLIESNKENEGSLIKGILHGYAFFLSGISGIETFFPKFLEIEIEVESMKHGSSVPGDLDEGILLAR